MKDEKADTYPPDNLQTLNLQGCWRDHLLQRVKP